MLNKVALSDPINRRRIKKFSHHIKLMVTRKYLFIFFLAGFLIFLFYDLCVVFQDIGKAAFLQSLFPKINSGNSLGIWRISSAVVIAFVERQKPCRFVFQMGAHPHFVVVNGKMHRTAPELKQKLAGIPISLVLLNRIFHRLLGDFVFQLKSDYRQTVNKNRHIQSKLRIIHAVLQLSGYAKNILTIKLLSLFVLLRGRSVKQFYLYRAILNTETKHINHAPPGNLTLQAMQKLGAFGCVLTKRKRFKGFGLGYVYKLNQFGKVNGEVAVIC